MIHYALVCEHDHEFEGWFRSSADFETQAARGILSCPVCGSAKVSRALMAPAVSTGRAAEPAVETPAPGPAAAAPALAPADVPAPVALAPSEDPRRALAIEFLRRVRETVLENATYVGDKFAEEARRIHYGEAEERGIYGEATRAEAEALEEEGIAVAVLPVLPEDRN